MSIQRFHTNDRMSQAVIHGDTVYLAGQVAQGAPGGTVTEQTQAILAQIDTLLAGAGTDKSKALSATIWLCSMDDFAEMNAVRGRRAATLRAVPVLSHRALPRPISRSRSG